MKIESTKDKVLIDSQELQQIVKEAIETRLSRKVFAQINFGKSNSGVMTAYCELADREQLL